MADRRSLAEGMKATPPVDPKLEKQFVYRPGGVEGDSPRSAVIHRPTAAQVARVPISTRMRTDFAQALKRASLERQLSGAEPNSLTEILEAAVEPWLRSHGYLS